MIRISPWLFILVGFLSPATIIQAAELELSPTDRILIVVPHPDDEVLCCSGIIQTAVQEHLPIQIVFLTNGDNNAWSFTLYQHFPVFRPKSMRQMGEVRHDETVAAADVFGVASEQLIFLGYPDFGTLTIWNDHWGHSPPYESRMTRVRAVPYATAYRPGAPYKGEEILRDLESIIKDFRPNKIFIPDPDDSQPDHRALNLFMTLALWDLAKEVAPQVYTYLVHFPDWPTLRGLHKDQALDPPSILEDNTHWLTFPLTIAQVDKKYAALEKHHTQMAYSSHFLTSFVRSNELFYDLSSSTATSPSLIESREQRRDVQMDFEDWEVAVDSMDLVISGNLSRKFKDSTEVWVAAYGYRRDTVFGEMPKTYMTIKGDHRRFTVRLPLTSLGRPESIFTSCGLVQGGKPLTGEPWRILNVLGS